MQNCSKKFLSLNSVKDLTCTKGLHKFEIDNFGADSVAADENEITERYFERYDVTIEITVFLVKEAILEEGLR